MNRESLLVGFTLIFSALLVFSVSALADQTNTLDTLQDAFNKTRTRIDTAFEQARVGALTAYSAAVATTAETLKKAGDLDGLLAVKAEKERFEKEKTVPEAAHVPHLSLAGAVTAYQSAMETADAAKSRNSLALLKGYEQSLDALVKQLTAQGKLDEAVKVRDEEKKIEFMVADAETQTPKTEKPIAQQPPVPLIVGRWTYALNRGGFSAQADARKDGTVMWHDSNGYRGTKYWSPLGASAYLISDKRGVQGNSGWHIVHLPVVDGVATCDDWGAGVKSATLRAQPVTQPDSPEQPQKSGDYPDISGTWVSDKTTIQIKQSGARWSGVGTYRVAGLGEVRCGASGFIKKTGSVTGSMGYKRSHENVWFGVKAQLSDDQTTVTGTYSGETSTPFTWVRQ